MEKRIKNIIKVALFMAIFGLMSFRDTGVFVKNFNAVKSGVETPFIEGEVVEILRTQDNKHIVKKNFNLFEVPFDTLIKTKKSGQKFYTGKQVNVLNEPNGQIREVLPAGRELQILQESGDYGLFEYGQGKKGYMYLADVSRLEERNVTKALSLTNEELNNGSAKLKLSEFAEVDIVNYLGGKYIIIDGSGNEFIIPPSKIKLATEEEIKEAATRASRPSSTRQRMVEFARSQLGKPYRYGTGGPNSFDCSGFTSYVYRQAAGVRISRSSRSQAGNGTYVEPNALQPGDLVFFNTSGKGISHVGLYIGDGKMIHASSGSNMRVMVSDVFSGYYKSRYVTARRILKD